MLFRLAVRNVRRQVGNYMIYFITVALTVALLYAINSIIMGEQIHRVMVTTPDFKTGMKLGVSFISVIVAFVLGYATSFMMKLRKREFGTYLTLGMTRNDILKIFLSETVLICVAALGCGIFSGWFIYQGLMAVIMNLMEMEFALSASPAAGLIFTIQLVTGIFLLSSVTSAVYLKRVSIYDLIHGAKKTERAVKHPLLWMIVMVISLTVMAGSAVVLNQLFKESILDGASTDGASGIMAVFAAGLVLFHIGLAKSVVYLLLKRKRFCNRKTNRFILRQLSGTLSSNAVMIGMLALLLTAAVVVSDVSFIQRGVEQEELDQEYPYDLLFTAEAGGFVMERNEQERKQEETLLRDAESVIGTYTPIVYKALYTTCTSGRNDIYSRTRWQFEGLNDSFMKVSDFNALAEPMGMKPLDLKHEFYIIANTPETGQISWKHMNLDIGGVKYVCKGVIENCPRICYVPVLAVVPDQAVEGMETDARFAAYMLADQKYDAAGLKKRLERMEKKAARRSHQNITYTFLLREYGRYERNSVNAILVTGSLFVALVLMFMAMAVLALKTLSGIEDDRKRYGILFRLGAGRREQGRALFWQTFSFFLMPFIFSVLVSIPVAVMGKNMMKLSGYEKMAEDIYPVAGAVASLMGLVYLLYYSMTYLIARKAVINRSGGRPG